MAVFAMGRFTIAAGARCIDVVRVIGCVKLFKRDRIKDMYVLNNVIFRC